MPPGAAVLTVEFKVNLMAPAAGEAFVARGRVLKAGRTLTTCSGDVFAVDGGDEKHVLTMLGTIMTVHNRVRPVRLAGSGIGPVETFPKRAEK